MLSFVLILDGFQNGLIFCAHGRRPARARVPRRPYGLYERVKFKIYLNLTRSRSKVPVAADHVKRIYDKYHKQKGTQLVFIDLSSPKGARVKEEMRMRLTR